MEHERAVAAPETVPAIFRASSVVDPNIALFCDALTDATTDNQRLFSLGLLKGALAQRVALMRKCVEAIQGAAQARGPDHQQAVMSRSPAFWARYAPVE